MTYGPRWRVRPPWAIASWWYHEPVAQRVRPRRSHPVGPHGRPVGVTRSGRVGWSTVWPAPVSAGRSGRVEPDRFNHPFIPATRRARHLNTWAETRSDYDRFHRPAGWDFQLDPRGPALPEVTRHDPTDRPGLTHLFEWSGRVTSQRDPAGPVRRVVSPPRVRPRRRRRRRSRPVRVGSGPAGPAGVVLTAARRNFWASLRGGPTHWAGAGGTTGAYRSTLYAALTVVAAAADGLAPPGWSGRVGTLRVVLRRYSARDRRRWRAVLRALLSRVGPARVSCVVRRARPHNGLRLRSTPRR